MADISHNDDAGSVWDEVNRRYDEPYSSEAICAYLRQLDEQLDKVIFRQVKALTVLEIATLRALGEDGLSTEDNMATGQALYHLEIFNHQLEVLESLIRRHLYQLTELPDPSGEAVKEDVIDYHQHRADFARHNREIAQPFLARGETPFDFNNWRVGQPKHPDHQL